MISADELSHDFAELEQMEAEAALAQLKLVEQYQREKRQQKYAWDHECAILDEEAERRAYD